jgi:hypothetical protein
MIARMRSLVRRLALPMVLLAPGLGGSWLQASHPCPTRHTPAVHAAAPADAHADHGTGQHQHPDAPADHGSDCTCVGTCGQSFARAVPVPIRPLVLAALVEQHIAPPVPAPWLPVSQPSDLLPLPNAPPRG